MRLPWVSCVCVTIATGCGPHASPTNAPANYTYALAIPPAGSWILGVEATFERSPSVRFAVPGGERAVRDVLVVEDRGETSLTRDGDTWLAPQCLSRCVVRYRVDLDVLASSCHGLDCLRRVGGAIVGPASAWLPRPEPMGNAIIHVVLRRGDPERFATGLRRGGATGYFFRANEVSESSYTAFGALRRTRLDVGGAQLDVALLGPPLSMGDAATLRWLKDGASCVFRFFGRFPVDASIFVIPVEHSDAVVFGRVMSLTGASIELLFGADTRAESAHSDLVVVHELFHLGTPSFVGESHWLEEGLATYYEPILRARAGWITEGDLWRDYATQMPRGLRKAGSPAGLEERDDIDSTYWGGALFALLADVRIRQATAGAHSLDDVVLAALAQYGDATHRARGVDFIALGDAVTGVRVLSDLNARFAVAGEPVDLDALWRSLGVNWPSTGPVLRDDAPLAAERRSITHP